MAAGETKITQEIIQDWLELDERDPEFQLLTEEGIRSGNPRLTAVRIRCADHATPSIRKSWH
jgi:hypothetical protein